MVKIKIPRIKASLIELREIEKLESNEVKKLESGIINRVKSDFLSESEIDDIERKKNIDYVKNSIQIIRKVITYVPFIFISIIVITILIQTIWS